MNKDPLNFGVSGIFGRMGQNPSINALTNANAIASQQPMMANSRMARPDMSQQVMTGSFDPLTQQVGMGIFGDQNARNMAVRGSGIMMHDDVQAKIQAKKAEIEKAKAKGGDPDIVYELQSDLMDLEKELKTAKEAHNSPANYGSPLNDDREIPQWRKEHNEKFAAEKAAIAAEKARLLEITRARREKTYGTDQSNFGKK